MPPALSPLHRRGGQHREARLEAHGERLRGGEEEVRRRRARVRSPTHMPHARPHAPHTHLIVDVDAAKLGEYDAHVVGPR